MNLSSVLKLKEHSVLRDDFVCFNKITGEVITLNHTGYLLLKLLNGNRTISEITNSIANAYQLEGDNIKSDALSFYERMASSDLIKKCKTDE